MSGQTIFDLSLVAIIAIAFLAGAKRGLVVGVFGLAGFIGGAMGGMAVAPHLLHSIDGTLKRALLTGLVVLLAASIGEAIMSRVARVARKIVLFGPLRLIDSLLGGIVAAGVVVLGIWVGTNVANLVGSNSVSNLIDHSAVLKQMDQHMPHSLMTWAKTETARLTG
ncbi:MAG TPA: CvpA family protein [Candidatus Nanopelagicaceae bacterium]|nr:CvpA family protein [Candidatus Nanopelagicaceae bacterium]